jgi:DNA-binding NtrC family response regulator
MDAELERRIRQAVDDASHRFLGVSIDRLSEDLSARLTHQHMPAEIDLTKDYRQAKRDFRKAIVVRFLVMHLGNISEAAKALRVDRRTLHRLIEDLGIDVSRIKKELIRPYDVRVSEVRSDISKVLDKYRQIIHPDKLESLYKNVDEISEQLARELPEDWPSLKEAESDFDRAYMEGVLGSHPGKGAAAKSMGIRPETLSRKRKRLF